MSVKLALAGLGNIGSYLLDLVCRFPAVTDMLLVDSQRYEPGNLLGQCIDGSHVGLAKAEVGRRRALSIAGGRLAVTAVEADLRAVPMGLFRERILMAALDSVGARTFLCEIAWRLGVPMVDAGVNADDGGMARVTVFVPGSDAPCKWCGVSDPSEIDVSDPCGSRTAEPTPTNAAAYLGAGAASLAANEVARLIACGGDGSPLAGREVVLVHGTYRLSNSRLTRNPACVFDHRTWPRIEPLARGPGDITVADALDLAGGDHSALRIHGDGFTRAYRCTCGGVRETPLFLSRRAPEGLRRCPAAGCDRRMMVSLLDSLEGLTADDLSAAELGRPLADLGFRPSDVFTVTAGDRERHYELPGDADGVE